MRTCLRILRWAARIPLLTAVGMAVAWQLAAALSPQLASGRAILIGAVGGVMIFAGALAFFIARPLSARFVEIPLLIVVAGFIAWLGWDPAAPELAHSLGPPIPTEAEPFRPILMKVVKHGESDSWPEIFPDSIYRDCTTLTPRDENYPTWLLAHAAEIDQGWERALPARNWLADANQCPVLSDFATELDSPLMSFRILRSLSVVHMHHAAQLALLGERDAALDALVPLATFARELRRGGRALVTVMTATVLEGNIHATAQFVLDQGAVAAAARERLAMALSDDVSDMSDLARCLRMEYDLGARAIDQVHSRLSEGEFLAIDEIGGFDPLAVVNRWTRDVIFFNPNATKLELRRWMAARADAIERGGIAELEKFNATLERRWRTLPHRNPIGELLLQMLTPAYRKVAENVDRRFRERHELLARLREG